MTATTHRMALVPVSGAQGAGKTTLAAALADSIAPGLAVRLSFADPIRDMLRAMGVTGFQDKATPRPELGGQTLRHAMQTLGTGWGRGMIGDTVWVDHLLRRLHAAWQAGAALAIVDDVRYHDEDEALRGWADARALPLLHVRVSRFPEGHLPPDTHASERDWTRFEWDLRIDHQDGDPAAWVKLALRALEKRGWYPPDAPRAGAVEVKDARGEVVAHAYPFSSADAPGMGYGDDLTVPAGPADGHLAAAQAHLLKVREVIGGDHPGDALLSAGLAAIGKLRFTLGGGG